MCRILAVTADRPVDVAGHLRAFAEIARDSREFQGHGWGCAWQDGGAWRTYHNILPVWEDDCSRFGEARVFLAHARSAFRDEGIAVENNMPFVDAPFAFVFNGELRGVRIAETGRIGAEKLFRFLVRRGAAEGADAMRTATRLVAQRTRYIRAMNVVIGGSGRFVVGSSFHEDAEYFTLHARRAEGLTAVCSEPYRGEPGWTALPNGTIEVIPWYSVKIGGGAAINLDGAAADIAALPGQVVVVHGANAQRDRLAGQLGREKRVVTSVSGYASVYSDESAIDLLMMAYAGLQNKRIVERLQRHGRNAVGLTGLDGRAVSGTRNKGIRVREGEKTLLLRDFSGKPSRVNEPLLRLLLDNGYTPVLTVPLVDEEGFAINSENDDVVALLQGVLKATHVIELIEAPGLLQDPSDPASALRSISASDLALLEERAEGRFKRKLLALRRLFEGTSPTVIVADGRTDHPVAGAMAGHGTTITASRGER